MVVLLKSKLFLKHYLQIVGKSMVLYKHTQTYDYLVWELLWMKPDHEQQITIKYFI